jgi:hypothetical protein
MLLSGLLRGRTERRRRSGLLALREAQNSSNMEHLEGGANEIRGKLKRSHKLSGGKARADPMERVESLLNKRKIGS